MKNVSLLLLGFALLVSGMAFAAPEANGRIAKEVAVSEKDNGQTVTLYKGQTLVVALPENGTTGYRWSVEEYKPSILELQDSTYKPTHSGGGLKPVGGGGTKFYNFLAKKVGETALELEYQRPWAETIPAAKQFSLKVLVKKLDMVNADVQIMESVQGKAAPGASRPGPEMRTGLTLKGLRASLADLEGSELKAVSAVEFRVGGQKEYVGLIIIKNTNERPRCPNDKLPMTNGALKTMVEKLLAHYGKKAEKLELAFLTGCFGPPNYTQVTLLGTGLGLYFNNETGEPMGKLTGKL